MVIIDPPPGILIEETVRFLGIDAPEYKPSKGSEPFAAEAREFVIAQAADSTVYLAFGIQRYVDYPNNRRHRNPPGFQ